MSSGQRRHRDRKRRQGRLGNVLNQAESVLEERMFRDMQAQQLRRLIQQNDEANPSLEAGQHRRGNEIGGEAKTQKPGQEEQRADQKRQCRSRRYELARVLIWHD